MSQAAKLAQARAYIADRGLKPMHWLGQGEQRMSPENPRYSLDDPGIMDALWMDNGSTPPVRPQRAIQTTAVYACVTLLAETLAALPLHIYRLDSNGETQLADTLPEYTLLHDEPNSYQTSYVFREQEQMQAALWGNAYAEIQRDAMTGRVIGLYPLPAWEVQPELINEAGTLRKIYRIAGEIFEDRDILHIPAPGYNGIAGMSPIALQRNSINLSLNADEFGGSFFKNGTRLSGVLEHPGKVTSEAATRLRESWQSVYAGKANAGKVAVLEEGMKFNPLSMPLADAQYLETRRFQLSEIARIYRVPGHMIGDMEHATFSNIEQQNIEFVQHTMLSWVTRWEQELNRKLFAHSPVLKGRYFVRFNLAGLLRGDMKSRYDAYAVGRQWGWLSANDVREQENMNRVEGGDIYLSPLNMIPADRAGEVLNSKISADVSTKGQP
jgi:HK97 family phage portal protein